MRRLFAKMLEERDPLKTNRPIVEGLGHLQSKYIPKYIDTILRSSSETFPDGLRYEGYKVLSPLEEYLDITHQRSSRQVYEMARSDFYMVELYFRHKDKQITRRLHLPYIREGGLIYLSGTLYQTIPIITDRVISPTATTIFVRLLRDKLIFKRQHHNVYVDGVKRALQVIYGTIYRRDPGNEKMVPTTKAVTTIVHYLLGKYGFTETCKKYLGYVPVVGGDEINDTNYTKDKWVIIKSTGVKPKDYIGKYYTPTNIRLAIEKDKWTPAMQNFVGGFMYLVDNFPEDIVISMLDDTRAWKIIMGYIVFTATYSTARLYTSIDEHFNSVDNYVDEIIKTRLAESGYIVNDFYDVLALVLCNYNDWLINAKNTSGSILNRYVDVLYYILFDITSGIFKINFSLNRVYERKGMITEKDINNMFSTHLSTDCIFSIISSRNGMNLALRVVGYPGDNMYPKITSTLQIQENGDGVRQKKAPTVPISCRYLTGPIIFIGSVLNTPKSMPTPWVKYNWTGHIDPSNGNVHLDKEQAIIADIIDDMLAGHDPLAE